MKFSKLEEQKLKDIAIAFSGSDRSYINSLIDEYDRYVSKGVKNSFGGQEQYIENLLARFSDNAVNSTYGLIWNAVDIPFDITHAKEPERDLKPLAKALANALEQRKTGFKQSLRHILKCFLEYGSGWIYVFNDYNGDLCHRVFSSREIARSLNIYNLPDVVYLDRGNDACTIVKTTETGQYHVYQKNISEKNTPEYIGKGEIPHSPILELSQTGGYNDKYPLGYGIKALSDLKRYHNIMQTLSSAANVGIHPIAYTSSGVNSQNKAGDSFFENTIGTPSNPILVDYAIGDKIFPIGYVPAPINSNDAWQLLQMSAVSIREAFNFIERLMTIKDNAQMTATEAQLRSQGDLSQVRDTIEVIFAFLNELHRTQLFLLKGHKDFKDWSDINPKDLNFFHTSIFKKSSDAQKISEISQGLDLAAKAIQFGAMAQQAGVDVIDSTSVLKEVASTTNLAMSSEKQSSTLASLFQNLTLDLPQQGASQNNTLAQ